MNETFEDHLKDIFMNDYIGTKDDVEDAFDGWLSNLEMQEVIDIADIWGDKIRRSYEVK